MAEQAQANPSGLMSIGTVAASNIALVLNLPTEHVPAIEKAIKNEISAMSSHFTMAFADVQTAYEIEVKNIKSTFSYVKANKAFVYGAFLGMFCAGIGIGALVTKI